MMNMFPRTCRNRICHICIIVFVIVVPRHFTITLAQTPTDTAPTDVSDIRTPSSPQAPQINGPKIYGVRPGKPFLFRIPATGRRPLCFLAAGLPEGLSLNSQTGIIAGRIISPEMKTYRVTLAAENDAGKDRREFRIVVGDTLALTPPMGWNSWYIYYCTVTEANMRAAADAMIRSGMADYGYQYVNIDDCWMQKRGQTPYRDADGAVLPNQTFPDIKGMCDYIHGKGLKAGTYTSPGPWTCADHVGAFQHEAQDARKIAQWGFDFLKYDMCSYRQFLKAKTRDEIIKPYKLMDETLRKQDRDIVMNLCEYGWGDVWEWGGQVGQCWRTTDDLAAPGGDGLPNFYKIGTSNARHWKFAGPGKWNDPDYILIGQIGDTTNWGRTSKPCNLSPEAQYSYISMWCLMASPLIYSGDMTKLDDFTLNVLCNAEVIEVDQDPLGRQARIIAQDKDRLILAKPMEDGSLAVGLFNLSPSKHTVAVAWKDLGLSAAQKIRDLWRQKDLGTFNNTFEASLELYDVCLIRLWPIQ